MDRYYFEKSLIVHEIKGYLNAAAEDELDNFSEDVVNYAKKLIDFINDSLERVEKLKG